MQQICSSNLAVVVGIFDRTRHSSTTPPQFYLVLLMFFYTARFLNFCIEKSEGLPKNFSVFNHFFNIQKHILLFLSHFWNNVLRLSQQRIFINISKSYENLKSISGKPSCRSWGSELIRNEGILKNFAKLVRTFLERIPLQIFYFYFSKDFQKMFSINHMSTTASEGEKLKVMINPLNANPTKWSNTHKQCVSCRTVCMCFTILWGWHLTGQGCQRQLISCSNFA